jgi:hypothetical protein
MVNTLAEDLQLAGPETLQGATNFIYRGTLATFLQTIISSS